METQRQTHEFGPYFNEDSEILILGSFPSVKSREQQFYYGHPQNRFWPVLAAVFGEEAPETIEEKKALLRRHRIALWDVIESCDIAGSADSSIRNAAVNDLSEVVPKTNVRRILVNGAAAYRLFEKHMAPQAEALGIRREDCIKMPSTSPANAAWSAARLTAVWGNAMK